ncbi:GNAT family N-acetyltransferase [Salipaludibacillus daqingensis]|uniref:GNAT family N-acetyltransferase n=1 Tax=Salipaludibacillus daqingensis TaxID=3041001 RepID=UPI002473F40B|nr:GNAT family N-acetyltransferase [Salipaludibacillus daqingensis]
MYFTRFDSASKMLEIAEDFLIRKEANHNLPLGVLRQLSKDESSSSSINKNNVMILGQDNNDKVTVVAVRTPPRNLIICGHLDALKETAKWIHAHEMTLPGVIGCTDTAKTFAEEWTKLTGAYAEEKLTQNIYQLKHLQKYPRNQGRLTYATEDDIALVMSWTEEFEKEALGLKEHPLLEETVIKEIRNNQVFLWRDENCTPVSMAKRARELKNGVVVNFVYTPEEYQRKGYATTCVGALSERMLNEGFKFCSLNTNAKNPTSNSIYMKIGYEPVGDAVEYQFKYK